MVGKSRAWGRDALRLQAGTAPLQAAQGPHNLHSEARGCSQLPGAAVSAEAPEGSRRSLTAVAIGHRSNPAWRPGLHSTLSTAQGGPRDTVPEGVGEECIIPLRWLKYKVTSQIALCCCGDISGGCGEEVPEPPHMLGLNLEGKTEAHAPLPPSGLGMGRGPDPATLQARPSTSQVRVRKD